MGSNRFSRYSRLKESGESTAWVTISAAVQEKPIRLKVRPATEANRDYFGELLKTFSRAQIRLARVRNAQGRGATPEIVKDHRNADRALFPHHIIVDWENVFDDKGMSVPFSVPACEELLDALPDDIFDDEIRIPAGMRELFVADDEMPSLPLEQEDVAATAEN